MRLFLTLKKLTKRLQINIIPKNLNQTECRHKEDSVMSAKPLTSYLIIKKDSNTTKFFIKVMFWMTLIKPFKNSLISMILLMKKSHNFSVNTILKKSKPVIKY